jgi:hypothetical protein
MGRWIQVLLTALVVGVAAVSVSFAGVPNPNLSTVPNVVTSPDGSLEYVVTVVGDEGPIDSALVQIVFSTEAAGLICWCTGQTQPLIQGATGPSGEASFFIAGGGCIDPDSVTTPPAVEVWANATKLKEVGVVSVDAVDEFQKLPHQGWDPAGTCASGLADGVFHTPPLKLGAISFCSDMDSDGDVDLDDAVLLTPGLRLGPTCTQAP